MTALRGAGPSGSQARTRVCGQREKGEPLRKRKRQCSLKSPVSRIAGAFLTLASSISEQGVKSTVQVWHFSKLPGEFARLTIPARRCAVFSHHAHIGKLADTIHQILTTWLPHPGSRSRMDRQAHRFSLTVMVNTSIRRKEKATWRLAADSSVMAPEGE